MTDLISGSADFSNQLEQQVSFDWLKSKLPFHVQFNSDIYADDVNRLRAYAIQAVKELRKNDAAYPNLAKFIFAAFAYNDAVHLHAQGPLQRLTSLQVQRFGKSGVYDVFLTRGVDSTATTAQYALDDFLYQYSVSDRGVDIMDVFDASRNPYFKSSIIGAVAEKAYDSKRFNLGSSLREPYLRLLDSQGGVIEPVDASKRTLAGRHFQNLRWPAYVAVVEFSKGAIFAARTE